MAHAATDDTEVAFDLYRKSGDRAEIKVNENAITVTNFQDVSADLSVDNTYRLCYHSSTVTIDTYTITAQQASAGLPYISIPLQGTEGIAPGLVYKANDISIGDLDGDGQYEIVLKRLISSTDDDEDSETGDTNDGIRHSVLLEAYRLDGTFMWRMAMGPNVPTGNGSSFAVYDFNGMVNAKLHCVLLKAPFRGWTGNW